MLPMLNNLEFSGGRVNKEYNFLLSVGGRVDCIVGSLEGRSEMWQRRPGYRERRDHYMQPHDRAFHIKESPQKPISFFQVDSSHACSSPPLIASIVGFDGFNPEIPDRLITILPKPNINQKIAVLVLKLEVRRRGLGSPSIDAVTQEGRAVPAAERARTFGFVVEGGTEGNNTFDLEQWTLSISAEQHSGIIDGIDILCQALTAPFLQ